LFAFAVALTASSIAGAAGSTLSLGLSGSYKGKPVNGPVVQGLVRCYQTGAGVEVQWSGSAKVNGSLKQVNGDMNFQRTGKSTFGPRGTAIASLVVNSDYSYRYGSGLRGGGGTGTLAKNRKSGTIAATVVSGKAKVREQGRWTCS